jgi:hypothetical protein
VRLDLLAVLLCNFFDAGRDTVWGDYTAPISISGFRGEHKYLIGMGLDKA